MKKFLILPFLFISGVSFGLRVPGLDCTGNTNDGALTADANGNVTCSDDDSTAGSGGGGYELEPATVAIQASTITAPSGDSEIYISSRVQIGLFTDNSLNEDIMLRVGGSYMNALFGYNDRTPSEPVEIGFIGNFSAGDETPGAGFRYRPYDTIIGGSGQTIVSGLDIFNSNDDAVFSVSSNGDRVLHMFSTATWKFFDGDNTNFVGLTVSSDVTHDSTYVLPVASGTVGQVLSIEAIYTSSVTLSWQDDDNSGGSSDPLSISSGAINDYFRLPAWSTNTVSYVGEVNLDSATLTNQGLPEIHDGTQITYVVTTTDTPSGLTNGIPVYRSASGLIRWEEAVTDAMQTGSTDTVTGAKTFTSSMTIHGTVYDTSGAGTSGQVLTSNGAGSAPTWQNASGASSEINEVFYPHDARVISTGTELSTVSFMTSLLFDDDTDETAYWTTALEPFTGSTIAVEFAWSMATASSNSVILDWSIMCVSDGDSADLDTESFSTAVSTTMSVPATAGYLTIGNIGLNDDSCASGDLIALKVNRDADNASDDAGGDFELRWVRLYSTSSGVGGTGGGGGGGGSLVLNSSATNTANTSSSITTTFDAGSDADLIVGMVSMRNSFSAQCTGMTWNGNAMTLSTTSLTTTGSRSYVYYITGSDTGSHDLVASISAGLGVDVALTGVSFANADQTTPIDGIVTTDTNSGTTTSSNVTSASGDIVMDFICVRAAAGFTMDGSQTNIADVDSGTDLSHGCSHKDGDTSVSMSWTHPADGYVRHHIGMNINAQ